MISASVLAPFSFSFLWAIHYASSWLYSCVDWISSSSYCDSLQLRVISQRMTKDEMVVDNIRERCGIQKKEYRSQNRLPSRQTLRQRYGLFLTVAV